MNKKSAYLFSILFGFLLLLPLAVDAYSFNRNLKQGDTGVDVTELQKALNTNPSTRVSATGAGSPGQETSYFGNATRKAVIAFQELYRSEVLTPVGLMQGSGFVGVLTRQKLNSMQNNTSISSGQTVTVYAPTQSLLSSVPVLTSLSTSTVGNGDRLVLYGKNFQTTNTILVSIEVPGKYANIYTASTTSAEIVFNSTLTEGIKRQFSSFASDVKAEIVDKIRIQMNKQSPSADGVWYFPATISIQNQYGTSNSLPIKINVLKGI